MFGSMFTNKQSDKFDFIQKITLYMYLTRKIYSSLNYTAVISLNVCFDLTKHTVAVHELKQSKKSLLNT